MFVKVIRDLQTENTGGPDTVITTLYECGRVSYRDVGTQNVLYEMEEPYISLEIEKSTTCVYLMNADGATVECHRWS